MDGLISMIGFDAGIIFLAGIWILLYVLVNRIKKSPNADQLNAWNVPVLGRLVQFGVLLGIVILLILLNPVMYGIIFGLIGLIVYHPFKDYFNGLVRLQKNEIGIGTEITIDSYTGRMNGIDFTGIQLESDKKQIYIPFGTVAEANIEKRSKNRSSFVKIICTDTQEVKGHPRTADLEKVLFEFPFLAQNSDSNIGMYGDHYEITTSITDQIYKSVLIDQIQQAGFNVMNKTDLN